MPDLRLDHWFYLASMADEPKVVATSSALKSVRHHPVRDCKRQDVLFEAYYPERLPPSQVGLSSIVNSGVLNCLRLGGRLQFAHSEGHVGFILNGFPPPVTCVGETNRLHLAGFLRAGGCIVRSEFGRSLRCTLRKISDQIQSKLRRSGESESVSRPKQRSEAASCVKLAQPPQDAKDLVDMD